MVCVSRFAFVFKLCIGERMGFVLISRIMASLR